MPESFIVVQKFILYRDARAVFSAISFQKTSLYFSNFGGDYTQIDYGDSEYLVKKFEKSTKSTVSFSNFYYKDL